MTYYFGKEELTHFGDNLVALDLLKKLARKFGVESEYMPHFGYLGEAVKELHEFIELSPLVKITDHRHPESVDLWTLPWIWNAQNRGEITDPWFPIRYTTGQGTQDIFEMWCTFGNEVSRSLGLPDIYTDVSQVLFDGEVFTIPTKTPDRFDVIMVNSYGGSQQMYFTNEQQDRYFESLAHYLRGHGKSVITTHRLPELPCTQDFGMSLTEIGRFAVECSSVIGCPTSPFLTTLNEIAFPNTNYINMSHHTPGQGSLFFSMGVHNIPADSVSHNIILELL